jgi:hypothetical protein
MTADDWVKLATVISALFTAASAGIAAWAAKLSFHAVQQSRAQAESARLSTQAMVFLAIYDRWNEVYPKCRTLIAKPIDFANAIATGISLDEYSLTDEWQGRLRPVLSFYEFIGSLLANGLIDAELVFAMVSIDVRLWVRYEPLIRHFQQSRPELYENAEALVKRKNAYEIARGHRLAGKSV